MALFQTSVLYKYLAEQDALAIKNEIDKTDAAIDKMVYALYGLTEDEIKIVGGVGG